MDVFVVIGFGAYSIVKKLASEFVRSIPGDVFRLYNSSTFIKGHLLLIFFPTQCISLFLLSPHRVYC